jgi:hypothetical protein
MVDLTDFVHSIPGSHGPVSGISSTPNLEDLDRQIAQAIDRLVLIFLPHFNLELCEAAGRELGAVFLTKLFTRLETQAQSKVASSLALETRIRQERIESRVARLKTEIEEMCDKRDATLSQMAYEAFQEQITQKAQELAPLRKLLRQRKELTQELEQFSTYALMQLRQALRRHLVSLESWMSVYKSIRPGFRQEILSIARLEDERSDLLLSPLEEEQEHV